MKTNLKRALFLMVMVCAAMIANAQTMQEVIYLKNGSIINGYRGFVDVGYTVGTGEWGADRVEFSTSHGNQICPYFFAGIGVGVHYYYDSNDWGIPIFADFRSDILNNSITPFVDFKIGYTVCDAKGFYTTVSVGCRFAAKYKSGFNIGIGYTAQKVDAWWWDTVNTGGINFKVGFDF